MVWNNNVGTLTVAGGSSQHLPAERATEQSAGLGNPQSVYVQGNYAYVADSGNGNLYIIDISKMH